MQTSHQPDIENIEGIFARLSDSHRPPCRPQGEELSMRDREYPAIGQMNLKRRERLGVVILSDGFNCHVICYSIGSRGLQSAAFF